MSEMVERVARVIAGSDAASEWEWGSSPLEVRAKDHFYERARAAIAAMREPVGDMLLVCQFNEAAHRLWIAMVDAALSEGERVK